MIVDFINWTGGTETESEKQKEEKNRQKGIQPESVRLSVIELVLQFFD